MTRGKDYIRGPMGGPEDPRHGTTNGYCNLDRRCDDCKKAWAKDHLEYMHRNPHQLLKQLERERERRQIERMMKRWK